MNAKLNRATIQRNNKRSLGYFRQKASFLSAALMVSSVVLPVGITTADAESDTNDNDTGSSEQTVNTNTLLTSKTVALATQSVSTGSFLQEVAKNAQTVAAANDLYASVMIAQAILESGWGSSSLSSAPNYNLFGIKGTYQGASVSMSTSEYINGKWITVVAQFRKYPSYAQSLQDNAHVLKTTSFKTGVYYYSGAWKSNTKTYKDATAWLTGRYATDPSYASKLNLIIANNNLTQYYTPADGTPSTVDTDTSGGSSSGTTDTSTGTTSKTYTVVSGDTLYRIAVNNGVSVANLKSWNSLSGDIIYVGQKLAIKGGSSTTTNTDTSGGSSSNSSTSTTSKTYSVVSGDTLYRIAANNGVSVANLKSWNSLSGDIIYVGQKLAIKGGSSTTTSTSTSGSTSSSSSSATSKSYTVASGDTLYRIAANNGVSVANLKSWNSLSGDIIYVGQKLAIKGGSSTTTSTSTTTSSSTASTVKLATTTSTTGQTYTVKSGDTLYRVATSNGVSVANLKTWNNLTSDLIYVGQKLALKSGTSTAASSSTSTSSSAKSTQTTVATTTSDQTYKVVSGDTLYKISKKYNVTVAELKTWNNLSNENILVGQTLTVQKEATYTVKSGDTLYAIAKKNNLTVKQLQTLNKLGNEQISVGQTLKLK